MSLHNADVSVGIGLNCAGDSCESSATRGVGANSCGAIDVLEEGQRSTSDCNRADIVPLIYGIVQLFSSGQTGQKL